MEIQPIVIGTAGHIDHGKSSLVRALTGIDPDRLKEEKERGLTIDLGFAHYLDAKLVGLAVHAEPTWPTAMEPRRGLAGELRRGDEQRENDQERSK